MSYEVGDKVIIKKRIGCSSDYPFGFIQEMADRAGEVVKIIRKEKADTEATYPGDGFKYIITPDSHSFGWASSMFEEPLTKNSGIKINKKHIVKLNFNL